MIALAALLMIAAQPGTLRHDSVPLDPDCPIQNRAPTPGPGDVCLGELGPNYAFAFLYPHAAAQIPALDRMLRAEQAAIERSDDGLRSLAAYAREHPEGSFFSETMYQVDADRPELLALSRETAEYSGGAHGWFAFGELLWDRTRSRQIGFADLFADPVAAFREIEQLLCPAFNASRRSVHTRDGGPPLPDRCPVAPYSARLVAGESGRVETLLLTFQDIDGYAGGTYYVEIPVNANLVAQLHPRFGAAFQMSTAAPRACNSNLPSCR